MFGYLASARRRRYELLDHLECLKSRRLDLAAITVAGIACGSAADEVPLERVVVARGAPIVAGERWSASGTRVCYDHAGRPLGHAAMVASAIAADGVLVLREQVGLVLRGGVVRGIELYPAALAHFCYLRSYVELLDQFGLPDTVTTRHADGAATDHTLVYRKADKQLVWCCRDNALCVARLGVLDARAPRRRPPGGRKVGHRGASLPLGIGHPVIGPPAWGFTRRPA